MSRPADSPHPQTLDAQEVGGGEKEQALSQFEQWTNFLPDVTAASAILDRILHHCEVVVLNGDSNRLRQAKGVVRPKN